MTSVPRASPPNVTSLTARIRNIARQSGEKGEWQVSENRLRRTIFNVVVAQMLPEGVVKGGTSIRLRLGSPRTRFSQDLDVATVEEFDTFLDRLDERLEEGWGGFSGIIQTRPKASPDGIPEQYVMQPALVRRDEAMPRDIIGVFRDIGLPDPAPIPVMEVHHQIAQKLHACTYVPSSGVNERAHDLVDLQVLVDSHVIDLRELGSIAALLFDYRRAHAWPPEVLARDGWEDLYREASAGLGVLPTVSEAVESANDLIRRVVAAGA